MASLPRVGIVVLNWHGRSETLACLQALTQLTYPDWSLVLVDNGCRDFSAEEVRRHVSAARYLHTETNLGFSGGANLGMRAALDDGADFVWFLNSDAQPESSALTELVAAANASTQNAIVGAKILQLQAPARLDSVALRVDLESGRILLMGHDESDRGQYDGLDEVAAVTGCAMLVSRRACEALNGFDDRFFAYLEDADLCLRARAAGLRVIAAPRARVRHDRRPANEARQSVSSLYYTARNHLLLMALHGRGSEMARRLRALRVGALNLAYAARATSGRSQRLRAVWRGLSDYRRGLTGGTWTE